MLLRNRISLIITLALLLTFALVGCGQQNAPTAPEEKPAAETESVVLDPVQKVVVSYVPIMKFATLYVAKERGLFEKYGLDVQLEPAKSGTEIIAFLTEGTVDVGGIAIVASTWNAWSQGLKPKIIAPGALEPLTNSPTKLLVRKALVDDGTVKDVADLKGLTVAMAGGPGSGGEYLASKGLALGGLTIADVEIVETGNADMPAAFENGSIDAGLLASPYADQTIESGHAVAIATDLTPGAMTVAFVGSEKLLNERPEAAQRFVLALMEAATMMQGDEYLSAENMAAYLAYVKTTEEALKSGAPVIYDPTQTIPLEGLKDIEAIHRGNGRTEYSDPIDLSTVADTSFVTWAAEHLNP